MGELHGERRVSEVQVESSPGFSRYTVTLPPASAGLLIVRPFIEKHASK